MSEKPQYHKYSVCPLQRWSVMIRKVVQKQIWDSLIPVSNCLFARLCFHCALAHPVGNTSQWKHLIILPFTLVFGRVFCQCDTVRLDDSVDLNWLLSGSMYCISYLLIYLFIDLYSFWKSGLLHLNTQKIKWHIYTLHGTGFRKDLSLNFWSSLAPMNETGFN